jgi:hypothetical protein
VQLQLLEHLQLQHVELLRDDVLELQQHQLLQLKPCPPVAVTSCR